MLPRYILLSVAALGASIVLGAQQVHIHSIDELNKEFGTDTHLKEVRYRLEPDFRTRVDLGEAELGFKKLHYPRVKVLKDGTYILFYQSSRIGFNCYCAFSKDGINWERGPVVFKGRPIVNSGGEKDNRGYSTVDAVVLDNGDVLAFCSYRAVKGYKRFPQDDGLCMKRSTDGGRTWGEEIEIYKTITWEPYAMQLPSGEVQVYFTDSDHDWDPASSGVTMLRSLDRGETWTTHCQVVRQYRATAVRKDGKPGTRKVWTDQMPSAVLLGDGKTILIAVESQDSTNHFHLSFAKDDTNWGTTLTGDMTGPAERLDNWRSGGGPYLSHFPSGETAVSFQGKYFNVALGLSSFKSLQNARFFQPFGTLRRGLWGSTQILDSHSLFAVAPGLDQNQEFGIINLVKMYLNHRVDAPYAHIKVDGDNIEWAANTDAFFLGSESQAQCCFRFAHNDLYLYMLVECLDEEMLYRDKLNFKFCNGVDDKDLFESYIEVGAKGVSVDKNLDARVYEEKGKGYLAEIAIPISELPHSPDKTFFYAEIRKPGVRDGFTRVGEKEYFAWLPIKMMGWE
ncbi:MAG: exo-alpha-sialidase [Bacteroidales bacterium]|nr:exo-alpha-sialidase [Bacteroidales bacterium]